MYRGSIVSVLRALNKDKNWRALLGKNDPDRHQRDVELILRLFALFENWQSYEQPMKEYLNTAMRTNIQFNSAKARRFKELFPKTCQSIMSALGAKPFHIRGPVNTSVLDAVFCAVLENDGKAPPAARERFNELRNDEAFAARTKLSTTDTMVVRQRIQDAKRYLQA